MMRLTPDGWAAIFAGIGIVIAVVVHLLRTGRQFGKVETTVKTINDDTLPNLAEWVGDLAKEQKDTTKKVSKLAVEMAENRATDKALVGRVDLLEDRVNRHFNGQGIGE
jgi:hypothetical protein